MAAPQPSNPLPFTRGIFNRRMPSSGWGVNVLDDEGNIKTNMGYPEGFKPWTEEDGDNRMFANNVTQEMRVFSYGSISKENHHDETYLPPSACWLDECTLFFVITMTQDCVFPRNRFWPKQFDENGDLREDRIGFGRGPMVEVWHRDDRWKGDEYIESYHIVYKHRWILSGSSDKPNVVDMPISRGHHLFGIEENTFDCEINKPYWAFGRDIYPEQYSNKNLDILTISVNQVSVKLNFMGTLLAERLERSEWLRCTNLVLAYLMERGTEHLDKYGILLNDNTVGHLSDGMPSLTLQHQPWFEEDGF